LRPLVRDDDERRDRLDLEPLDQFGVGVGVDAQELEGVVIGPPLQNLREETLDATAASRRRRMEEEQARLRADDLVPRGLVRLSRLRRHAASMPPPADVNGRLRSAKGGRGTSSARASWR